MSEAYHSTFGCLLGPPGWLIADWLMSLPGAEPPQPPQPPQPPRRVTSANHVTLPPRGALFVRNEILLEVDAGADARLTALARRLNLTRLETQDFTLTGRSLQRWRINGNRSVVATLNAIGNAGVAAAAQANYFYGLPQQAAAATDSGTQYVVPKLHLTEAHRITTGTDVIVAVIDSKIDAKHSDLAGVIAGENDVVGTAAPAHMHGTAMAGAIAAHSKLIGVAPKVRLLAVRAFSGTSEGAQGTTFNILKGLDWAASRDARIVNMSFAGPTDPMLRDMIGKAHAHGMVLIAAVGNAGPRSPPLYPAAYAEVIGVTATDADDKLLPVANRGALCGGRRARRRHPRRRARGKVPDHHRHLGRHGPCHRGGGIDAGARADADARPGAQAADRQRPPGARRAPRRRRRRDRRAARHRSALGLAAGGQGGRRD